MTQGCSIAGDDDDRQGGQVDVAGSCPRRWHDACPRPRQETQETTDLDPRLQGRIFQGQYQ